MFFGHEHLGKSIALLRDSRAVSQKELAEKIGMKPTALSSLERGKRAIDEEDLLRICEELGFDPIKVWDLAYQAFRYNYYLERANAEGIAVEELIERVERLPSQQRLREGYQAWKEEESRFFELILPTLKPPVEPGLESQGLLTMWIKPPAKKKSPSRKAVRFDPPKGKKRA